MRPIPVVRCTIGLAIIALLLASCKKADHYAQLVNDQPILVSVNSNVYFVGDTATFSGKFFLDRSGSQIRVGSETAQILGRSKRVGNPPVNSYTQQPDSLDVVRFLITKSMGLGNNISTSVTANGITIQGPSVTIQQFQGIIRKTDTTLYVDSLISWLPTDAVLLNSLFSPLVNGISVSGDGTICLNNITGIYLIRAGQATQKLAKGNELQENGVSFTVNVVLGSVLSFGGDTLIFSAEVLENSPDAATNYIFRLCKMDLVSGAVATINRTEVPKGIAAANATPGPFTGAANALPLVATSLQTDANGAIYFLNDYAPPRTDWDETNDWYIGNGLGSISTGLTYFNGSSYVLANIDRIDGSGTVSSIFSFNLPGTELLYRPPGFPSVNTSIFLISEDGSTAYIGDQVNFLGNIGSLAYVDLHQDVPLLSTTLNPPAYRFFSYDTYSVTGTPGITTFTLNLNFNVPYTLLILPDGDLLQTETGSLAAINLLSKSAYVYAGTEAGIGSPPPAQNQTTGPAKYVNFGMISQVSLAGVDKSSAVYYYFADNITGALNFYKLYSKK